MSGNSRYILSILLLCCLCESMSAQNYVFNGDFEIASGCPVTLSTVSYSPGFNLFPFLPGWVTPFKNGSPDYYRNCGYNWPYTTPGNLAGYQQPHSGVSYVGIIGYKNPTGDSADGYRELIMTRITPLIKDSSYFVKFFVNPTFSGFLNSGFGSVALNEIGANLSDTMPNSTTVFQMNLRYDILNDTSRKLISDSLWYEIHGVYKAHGGEQWLTIGNFCRTAVPNTSPSSLGKAGVFSYLYVDDISIMPARIISHVVKDCDSTLHSMLLSSSKSPGIYQWSSGDTTRAISITRPGNYVCIAHDDSVYCIDSFQIIPHAYSASHTVQACDSLNNHNILIATLASARYHWSTGDTTGSIAVARPANYVCLAANLCANYTDSFQVIAGSYDSIHAIPICDPVTVDTALSSSVMGSPYYAWSTGDSSPRIRILQKGDYICEAFNGCYFIRDTFHVFAGIPAVPDVHDTAICQYVVAPVISIGAKTVVWYENSWSGKGSLTQPVINTDQPGLISLYVAAKEWDCVSDRVPIHINIKPTPQIQASDTLVRCEATINFYQTVGTLLPFEVHYAWSSGEKACCIIPQLEGQYIRVASNDCGEAADTFLVIARPCDHCVVFPAAFTPNDDGRNDGFGPVIRCPVLNFYMSVYNRWGQRIYASNDKTQKWDGKQNGEPAPVDVYMYMASMFNAATGKRIFIKGDVTLIR